MTDVSELLPPLNPLPPEHRELVKEAKRSRRAFAAGPLSKAARAFQDAIGEYLTARSQGVDRESAFGGLEEVLRSLLPFKPMAAQWVSCSVCEGTGQRLATCHHNLRCGRFRCSLAEPQYEHSYAVPCDCSKGVRFRPKPEKKSADEELASVGKTRKSTKRGFSRFGQ